MLWNIHYLLTNIEYFTCTCLETQQDNFQHVDGRKYVDNQMNAMSNFVCQMLKAAC